MRLALECPTSMLEQIQPFGDFDFILAHKAATDEKYFKYFEDSTRFKVLDNGVNENGEPFTSEKLKVLVEKLKIDKVVSPDWVGDREKTLGAYEQCVKDFGEDKVIGVLQGATVVEALSCLNFYRGSVMVPYRVGGSTLKTPPQVEALTRALVVCNIPAERTVHLLGFTTLEELEWYRPRLNVTSIDSGIPVLLGLRGEDILDPLESKEIPTMQSMEKLQFTQETYTAIVRNIALLRKALC